MTVEVRDQGEMGQGGAGVGLVFEASFSLAYGDSDNSDHPGLVIEDILARIHMMLLDSIVLASSGHRIYMCHDRLYRYEHLCVPYLRVVQPQQPVKSAN